MKVEIAITTSRIDTAEPPPAGLAGMIGARVGFTGIVRGLEGDREIGALEYEAYSPMAENVMRAILDDIAQRHPCLSVHVSHRVGIVPVGEAALHIHATAAHRAPALALVTEFLDRLKQDVPIWKCRALPAGEAAAVPAGLSGSPPFEAASPKPPSPVAAATVGGEAHGSGNDLKRSAQPQPVRSASVTETLAMIAAQVRPLDSGRVPLAQAAGRVLREKVCAPEDQPAFDRSSVDGYAVRLEDDSTRFRVVGFIRAGDWKPLRLRPGEAVEIATGGALPEDGLQVVMKEDVRADGAEIVVARRPAERSIRFRGEDARAGTELVPEGSLLTSGALGLLASAGCAHPLVTRLPRVLHVATGDEIVPPDETPRPGQVRDSNSVLVRAFLSHWGVVPEQVRAGEDPATVRAATSGQPPGSLLDAPATAKAGTPITDWDLLLISGGASVGEHDFTKQVLEDLGFTIHVCRTTTRPGKPLIFATCGAKVAFGLPGNPLAHFVCLNLYVRAALEALLGIRTRPAFHHGVLALDFQTDANSRETLWPALLALQHGRAELTPLPWRSSGDLTALATANALVRIPPGCSSLARGAGIEFASTTAFP